MSSRLASFRLGSEAISGTFVRARPTATLTSPPGTINQTAAPAVSWTYSSPVSRAQAGFRVRLKSADGASTWFDSFNVTSTATTYTPTYALSDLSQYLVVLNVWDGYDWSDDITTTFRAYGADVSTYGNADVGSIYEIGINGQGYMLADTPGSDFTYRRQTVPLDSPRFATGDTPFSEAVDRYTFVGWADWSDGAGQTYKNRSDSSDNAYFDSEGINPFNHSGLQLLNATASTLATSYSNPISVIANNKLYVLTGAKQLTEVASIGGSTTAFSVAAGTTFTALASDGTNWYAADGANVFKGSGASDPGAAWSTVDVQVMEWAGDRLCVAYPSSGTTPNAFTTLDPSGVSELGAGVARLTLAVGTTITSITGGNGYVWIAVKNGQRGLVYAWQAGSTDAPFIAFEFPVGQFPQALGFYLSNVFIRTVEPLSGGGARATIYRAATSDGKLVPTVVTQLQSGTDDHTIGDWAGNSNLALFSWKKLTAAGASGVGAIDLTTGGWARWVYAPSSSVTGDVRSICSWNGRTVFSVAGSGVYAEGTTPLATGNLRTSFADLGTSVVKVMGQLRLETLPLPANASVSVEYSLDAGSSYAPTIFSFSDAGGLNLDGEIDKQAGSIGLRITLAATTVTPTVRTATVRVHPYGLADQVITLPINCANKLAGLNGQTIIEPGQGQRPGAARARALEALVQTRVKFQDVDWDKDNPVSTIWEVQSVDVRSIGVMDRSQNRQVQSQVAIVTMRRSLR